MKYMLCATLIALLAGCGGKNVQDAGSGSSSSGSQAMTVVIQKNEVIMRESYTATLQVALTNAQGATFLATSTNPQVTATYSNGELKVTAGAIDNPVHAVVTLTGSIGSNKASDSVDVSVTNTSAESYEEDARALAAKASSIATFEEDKLLFDFVNNLAYKSGYQSALEQQTRATQFASVLTSSSALSKSDLAALSATLADYDAGKAGEQALKQSFDKVTSTLDLCTTNLLREVNAAMKLAKLSTIPDMGLIYNGEIDVYSHYVGNTNIGSFTGTSWAYSASYAFMSKVINNATCAAE